MTLVDSCFLACVVDCTCKTCVESLNPVIQLCVRIICGQPLLTQTSHCQNINAHSTAEIYLTQCSGGKF